MSVPFPECSDEALAQATGKGSLKAFEVLVQRYEKRIFGFLRQRVGQVADAEDLAQQTFIQAFQRIHQYKIEYQFTPWLFTIARNLAVSHFRRQARHKLDLYDPEYFNSETPPRTLSQQEAGSRLWALAKTELNESHFSVIWLHYAEDMSINNIAAVLNLSQTNVKVMLHRARKRLAEHLEQQTELTDELQPLRLKGD